jgi:hypothetical protein
MGARSNAGSPHQGICQESVVDVCTPGGLCSFQLRSELLKTLFVCSLVLQLLIGCFRLCHRSSSGPVLRCQRLMLLCKLLLQLCQLVLRHWHSMTMTLVTAPQLVQSSQAGPAVRQGDEHSSTHLSSSLSLSRSITLTNGRLALLYQAIQLLRQPLLLLQNSTAMVCIVQQVPRHTAAKRVLLRGSSRS